MNFIANGIVLFQNSQIAVGYVQIALRWRQQIKALLLGPLKVVWTQNTRIVTSVVWVWTSNWSYFVFRFEKAARLRTENYRIQKALVLHFYYAKFSLFFIYYRYGPNTAVVHT